MHLPSLPILGGLFGASELVLALTKRAKGRSESRDRRSIWLLWGAIAGGIFAASLVAHAMPAFRFSSGLYVYGFAAFCCGLVVRWYAILYLGRFFTVDVAIHSDHHVVDSGPYRFVRHPSYLGALMAFLGLGVCWLNWISMLVVFVPIAAAFAFRIRVEEAALLESLGEPYKVYSARTKRLIPFIY
jgi:protein-S-isoprenylcysteine O-methyltransferase